MSKIKLKNELKRDIKSIDRICNEVYNQKEKNINTKESVEGKTSNNVLTTGKILTEEMIRNNYDRLNKSLKEKIQSKIKNKLFKEKSIITKQAKKSIKNTKREIKTTKIAIEKTEKTVKVSAKTISEIVKVSIKGIKETIRITIEIIKALIEALKSLIGAIVSGGWVSVIIIVVIALIGIICSSVYGIFFSSEKENEIKMSSIVKEINGNLADRITEIQNINSYDEYRIKSNRAEWKEILAIYSVKNSKDNNEDIMSLNEEKKEIIKKIFWDFNSISSYVNEETTDNGTNKILYIVISSKTKEEIMTQYSFSKEQINQVNELLSNEYSAMWASVIHGTPLGTPDIVEIALSQEGTKGGEPYWRWYGFDERIEWCACFVSWAADQLGLIEANVIPKFAGCQDGIDWFKAMGEWQEKGYIPNPGDIIFFDWEVDDSVSHVGIVEKVEGGKIYTIEGNSGDDVKRQKYSIDSKYIYGYGVPIY